MAATRNSPGSRTVSPAGRFLAELGGTCALFSYNTHSGWTLPGTGEGGSNDDRPARAAPSTTTGRS